MENLKINSYYLRDTNNHPVVTVCVMKYKERTARGVSICNTKEDNIDKKYGRNLARKRAFFALSDRKTGLGIRRRSVFLTLNFNILDEWFFKSEYNPELTKFERQLLKI